MPDIDVPPNTIVIYSDLSCPWAHMAVHRLHATRQRLGLEDAVRFEPRAFPLELINEMPTPKLILEAEIPVVGGAEPDAGWQVWQSPAHEWPVTILPAIEAVEATKAQSALAAERLDIALRRAFFAESRSISMRHVILEVAQKTDDADVDALREALVAGTARAAVEDQLAVSLTDQVQGSPHLFLPDGTSVHNPGITLRWEGGYGIRYPIITADEPAIYDDLLHRAAA